MLAIVPHSAPWLPTFTNGDTKAAVDVSEYYFAIGLPDCGSHQMFPVYDYYKVSGTGVYVQGRTTKKYA